MTDHQDHNDPAQAARPDDGTPSEGTASVAELTHQLIEPLSAITFYLEAVRLMLESRNLDQIDKARDAIRRAEEQMARASNLLKQLHRITS